MSIAGYRISFTPSGAGLVSLAFPGLLISMAARDRALVAVALGAAIALVVNAVWAVAALHRVSVAVAGPACATAGSPVGIAATLTGPSSDECAVRIENLGGWHTVRVPSTTELVLRPTHRAVHEDLEVELSTSVPLGLVSCIRRRCVALEHPLHVAPEAVAVSLGSIEPAAFAVAGQREVEPIGIRPYVAGDPRHDIHWPSVARTGTLLVRDRPAGSMLDRVLVVVDSSPSDDFDRRLGMTRAVVERLLGAGQEVMLLTQEHGPSEHGPSEHSAPERVARRVTAGDELLRRLAGAAEPAPSAPPVLRDGVPAGSGGSVLKIDDSGASWRFES